MNRIFFSQNSQSESSTPITILVGLGLISSINISFVPITHKCPVDLTVSGTCKSGTSRGIYTTTLKANTNYSKGVSIPDSDINWQIAIGGDTPTTIDSISTATVSPRSSSGYTYSTSILSL